MRSLLFYFISLLFLYSQANAQIEPNQKNLDFLLHNILFEELAKSTRDSSCKELFDRFLSVKLNIDTLEDEGFGGRFLFLYVSVDSLQYTQSNRVPGFANMNDYIVGVFVRGMRIYRLSGFRKNDFPYFVQFIKERNKNDLVHEKILLNKCKIEKLNLKLLKKSFRKFKIQKHQKKYPKFWYDDGIITTH